MNSIEDLGLKEELTIFFFFQSLLSFSFDSFSLDLPIYLH